MASWLSTIAHSLQPYDARQRIHHEKRILDEPAPSQDVVRQKTSSRTNSGADTSTRSRSKLLFSAGATFFAFSLLITRRSFARRRAAASLLNHHPRQQLAPINSSSSSSSGTTAAQLTNHFTTNPAHTAAQSSRVSPSLEALEALNIATINVVSVAMMAVGGALWYLDIDTVEDARRLLRGGLGVDGSGRSETEAEEEMEEWMARVLSRGEERDRQKETIPSRSAAKRILDER